MPILDVAAKNDALDGDTLLARDDGELALFDGDPADTGVELAAIDCPGYARAGILAADWAAATDGERMTATILFPDATAAWETTASHWAIYYPGLSAWGDSGPLSEELDITAAGAGPAVQVVVFYDDEVDPES